MQISGREHTEVIPVDYMIDRLFEHMAKMGVDMDYIAERFQSGNGGCYFDEAGGFAVWLCDGIPLMRLTLSFPFVDPRWFQPELGPIPVEEQA